MIIQATRIRRDGGVRYLACHLLDKVAENECIEVLAGDRQSLDDAHALASAKGCRYSVRHLSVSPERDMSPAQLSKFINAIDAEFCVGRDRPRLIVRHIKKGRSHFHIAIGEVDPISFLILDCRNDFARLETIARNYETTEGESVQPTRAERRQCKTEGFSDVARKRAERTAPEFDRAKLRKAFTAGRSAFDQEMNQQGLRIVDGDKGPILVTTDNTFVAAACRAVGVRRTEFQKFLKEEIPHEPLIGNQPERADHLIKHGKCCDAPPAAPDATGNAGTTRQDRSTARNLAPHPQHAGATGHRPENDHGSPRPSIPSISLWRRQERLLLYRLNKIDLDDLLRRARELANWMRSIFEPPTIRLIREIENAKRQKSFPQPPEQKDASASSYTYERSFTP